MHLLHASDANTGVGAENALHRFRVEDPTVCAWSIRTSSKTGYANALATDDRRAALR